MKNEIAVRDKNIALELAKLLVDEEYVVMLSKEECLYIINFEYAEYSDRNDVVFMNREEFDSQYQMILTEDTD